jgi:fibronectin type 3 domain-containing protein
MSFPAIMRPAFIGLFVLAAASSIETRAASISFAWDPASSSAVGYALYCGSSSGQYATRTDVGNATTYTMLSVPEGTAYFCAVAAYDAAKVESAYSNEVSGTVPITNPTTSKHKGKRSRSG